MVVCVIILLLITAGFPEYDAVYFDSPGPNAAFTVPENSPSYDVATFDLVGTTPSAIIKKQEPTNPEFELVLVGFSYILRAPALDFETEHTYTLTIEASDSADGSTDAQTHTVTVTDINEKPMFTQTTFNATIESRDLYQVVVDINPTDVDTEPPNSAANCTIEDGNGNGYFQIEYSTCLISTDTLLVVGQTFTLTIGLADQGTPPLTADQNAVVTIEVIEPATTTTTTTTPTTTTTTTTPTTTTTTTTPTTTTTTTTPTTTTTTTTPTTTTTTTTPTTTTTTTTPTTTTTTTTPTTTTTTTTPTTTTTTTTPTTTTTTTTPTTTTTTTTPTTTTTTTTPTTTTTTPTTTTTTRTTTTSIGASSVSDQAFQDNITPEKNREISEAISNLFWVCAGIVIVAIALVDGISIVKSIKGGKKADEHKQTRQIPASHQYPL